MNKNKKQRESSKPSVNRKDDKQESGNKITEERIENIVKAVKLGNYLQIAARYSGITAGTLDRWLDLGRSRKRGPYRALYLKVRAAEAFAEVRALELISHGMISDPKIALEYLARRYPERWGKKDKVSIRSDVKVTLTDLILQSYRGLPTGRTVDVTPDRTALTPRPLTGDEQRLRGIAHNRRNERKSGK